MIGGAEPGFEPLDDGREHRIIQQVIGGDAGTRVVGTRKPGCEPGEVALHGDIKVGAKPAPA